MPRGISSKVFDNFQRKFLSAGGGKQKEAAGMKHLKVTIRYERSLRSRDDEGDEELQLIVPGVLFYHREAEGEEGLCDMRGKERQRDS